VLEEHVARAVSSYLRIDGVAARAKSVDSFVAKSQKVVEGTRKYSDPFAQIQDQVGVRIVTYYLCDVDAVCDLVNRSYRPIEERYLAPESPNEFGYEGKHLVLLMPPDVAPSFDKEQCPRFFELQIKTLFQHAWSQADHDLGYKPSTDLTHEQKRRIALAAALAWGVDQVYTQLATELGIDPRYTKSSCIETVG
jgi:ppGpp synthetase/RelA/SpoT-type nucleotidyltranferase